MSDADEWDFSCAVCSRAQPCLLDSDVNQQGLCRSCKDKKEEKTMAGVVNTCAGCGDKCWDMEPCEKCGLSGHEVAQGLHPKDKIRVTVAPIKKEKMMINKGEKLYAIVKIGFEYNDEYYTKKGIEGVTKLFRNRQKAEDELDRMNGKWLRTDGKHIRVSSGYGEEQPNTGYELIEVEADEIEG